MTDLAGISTERLQKMLKRLQSKTLTLSHGGVNHNPLSLNLAEEASRIEAELQQRKAQ